MFRRRVLLLTETFPPGVGGVQRYLAGLWAALPSEASGVIAPEAPGAAAWDAQQKYRITRTPMSGWTVPRWRPALATLRRVVAEVRPEVIVCGKALFEGRAVLALVQRTERGSMRANPSSYLLPPAPYVVLTYGMEIRTWLNSWKTRRDLLRVLRNAARVVVINAATKRELLAVGVPEEKLVKIYPGVAESFFSRPAGVEEFRARLELGERRVILSVARLVPRKGLDTVIQALPNIRREIPSVVYLHVGTGPDRSRLERLAESAGVRDAVRFVGDCSEEDLRRAYALAELFVLTPRESPDDVEGFGIVYLEAAAEGVTSVGSTTGGVPEAVLDGDTGILVPPDDPQATAHAIVRLLSDDTLRSPLASAASERARREFTWARRALLFQGMVEAVMQERSKAAKNE